MPDIFKKLVLQNVDVQNISPRKSNKLVRDRIPEIIKQSGRTPIVETLSGLELKDALNAKLIEEVEEFLNAPDDNKAVEELADIFEVISALATWHNFSEDELLTFAQNKRKYRGGFTRGLYYRGDT